jgi:ubiquitin conjugation factor E4 B
MNSLATDAPFSFITRILFFALRAYHLGTSRVINKRRNLHRQLSYLHNMLENPAHSAQRPMMQMRYDALIASKLTEDIYLTDKSRLVTTLKVLSASARWIVLEACASVSAESMNKSLSDFNFSIPLNPTPSEAFAAIPQMFLEDIVETIIFIGQECHEFFDEIDMRDIYIFLLIFTSSPTYVHSPHLRAKLGDALFYGFLPKSARSNEGSRPGEKSSTNVDLLLRNYSLGHVLLAPSLMALYGDVEKTG